jgi:hypothetical protein
MENNGAIGNRQWARRGGGFVEVGGGEMNSRTIEQQNN